MVFTPHVPLHSEMVELKFKRKTCNAILNITFSILTQNIIFMSVALGHFVRASV